uniref:Uncharacterized protein n=1 Tax=Arundo donax TaxID=35708 RepID=A0A0A9F4V6_ARUDO
MLITWLCCKKMSSSIESSLLTSAKFFVANQNRC